MSSIAQLVEGLNSVLDPKIHQVIGSTPASIRASVETAGVEGNKSVGMAFISLSIFAAAVNKPTAESLFLESDMQSVRQTVGAKFMLNGKINMTALTLAGHCFMTNDVIASSNFARALREKMGAKTIWLVSAATGNLSDTQRKIYMEKAKHIDQGEASEFCRWFLEYTGWTASTRAARTADIASSSGTAQRAASAAEDPTEAEMGAFVYELPNDDGLRDWYYGIKGRTRRDLFLLVRRVGERKAEAAVRKSMREERGSAVDDATAINV